MLLPTLVGFFYKDITKIHFVYYASTGNRPLSRIFVSSFRLTKISLHRPPLAATDCSFLAIRLRGGSVRFPGLAIKNIVIKCFAFTSLFLCEHGESNPDIILGKDVFCH